MNSFEENVAEKADETQVDIVEETSKKKPFLKWGLIALIVVAVIAIVVVGIGMFGDKPVDGKVVEYGVYTGSELSTNAAGTTVYVRLNEAPSAMSIRFFSLVSNETGKTYKAGAYKDITNNKIEIDPGKVELTLAMDDGEAKDFVKKDIEVYFLVDQEIDDTFTLIYKGTKSEKEYPLSEAN